MIKQDIVCENAKVKCQERYVQVLDEFVKGIRVWPEPSSSMLCIPPQVNATSNNVRFTPKSSIMSVRL
jgi:hypothetical protein